jgi:succinoglycan biosynthesis protein ExoM
MEDSPNRLTIAVAICTYNRNKALATLLEALLVCTTRVAERAAVGVVVVDDSADGKARTVVEQFEGRFELGMTYRFSGRQNISLARNLAIETGSEMSNWTVMIDDDCEPGPELLAAMLDTQKHTGADAVTGTMLRRVPTGSPRWLTEEPFLELDVIRYDEGARLQMARTSNSMISSGWLKEHPTIRFQPALGVTGGEEPVFYRTACEAGLRIHYSQEAFVYENEPSSRATFGYQARIFFWHGNSSYVSCVLTGNRPFRMLLHGINSLRKALVRPVVRLLRGERPQMRYCFASALQAIGIIVGLFGVRVSHPVTFDE